MTVGLNWYPELVGLFSRPGSLAFTHVGAIHRTADFNGTVLAAERQIGSSPFDLLGRDLREWAGAAAHGEFAIVLPGDPAQGHGPIEEALLQLRELFADARGRGASIWFLSEYPLSRFPVLAASSLLADAETVRLRLVDNEFAVELILPVVKDQAAAERVARFASGSRALLQQFAETEASEGGGREKLRHVSCVERAVADRAWEELGPDLLSLMDTWVYESLIESLPAEEVPNEAILAGLLASGLARLSTHDQIEVLPFVNRQIWVDALGAAVGRCIEAPDSWMKVASELFALERRLRMAIAERLESDLGEEWRSAGLQEYAEGLVELARRDGIASATTVDRLRSPLDWLQLSDLLSLAQKLCAAGPVLGLRVDDWERVSSSVLHVRHRVAHMRLLRAGDLENVRRIRRLIDLRSQA